MANTIFIQLSKHWNAEPNVPEPSVSFDERDLVLSFRLNHWLYPIFIDGEFGFIRFTDCAMWRMGPENDEGWYLGQCRYSKIAPAWGEFYEVSGDDPLRHARDDWQDRLQSNRGRHFIFYFRDDMFECLAGDWHFEAVPENALASKLSAR